MEGRATGEPGLEKAAGYLRSQAKEIGLKPIDEDKDYFQNYTLVTQKFSAGRSYIKVSGPESEGKPISRPFYVFNADTDRLVLNGDAVFAGYGIYSGEDNYNDFEGLDLKDKIVLIMNRGPMDENGQNLLGGQDWSSRRSFRYKMSAMVMRGAKAVLIVMDPKSGDASLDESSPGMARYFSQSVSVKELGNERSYMPDIATKMLIVHRDVADEILKSGGRTLAELQDSIDTHLKPYSFELPGTSIEISASYDHTEKSVPNVVGLIEGSDPVLKDEVMVFSAHFDHLGTDGQGGIYNGADDNGSGTCALLELAEAFKAEQKNLKRSVMILWISGEEIGLYGSRYYSEYPLIPLEKTVADMNLDMIGRVRTARDTGMIYNEKVNVEEMDVISLIGGHQSKDLMNIHLEEAHKLKIKTDTIFNDPDHPYRYYYRSDHINFARHNIPILFYSTGSHVDYHKVSDESGRINFEKLKKVTELAFLVGYEVCTRKEDIVVDNPFSDWGRMRSY